jgi:transcriptional regulator with XRE-family HTH domain
MKISTRIKGLRKLTGMSQAATARKAGVSQGYLSQLENDDVRSPSHRILSGLAKAFGMTLAEFMQEKKPHIDLHPALAEVLIQLSLPQQGALAAFLENFGQARKGV